MTLDELTALKGELFQNFSGYHSVVVHETGIDGHEEYVRIHGSLPLDFKGKKVNHIYAEQAAFASVSKTEMSIGSPHEILVYGAGANKKEDSLSLYFDGPFGGAKVTYERKPSDSNNS